MARQTTDVHVNPSDETIHLGPLAVRFLITGEDATGSVALFELTVPAAQRLAAPAHSHDHYEETIYGNEGVLTWTVDGKRVDVGPGQALCIPRGAVHRFDNAGSQAREGPLCHHARRDRAAVFSRVCRGDQRGRRRAVGPSQNGRHHAPPWPDAGAVTGGGEPQSFKSAEACFDVGGEAQAVRARRGPRARGWRVNHS
jgi:quercetin dioxygenase-like cupin family protein